MGFLDERCLFQELTDEKIAVSKPFYCGNNDLDEFFHEDVTKFSYNLMGKSSRRDYMKHMTHKHMRRYPGVLVGRLAVNQEYSHKGIGSEALLFIKQWFLSPDNKTGCRFVVVDAVNDPNVLQFYQKNGFVFLFTTEEQNLSIQVVRRASPSS